MGYSILAGIGTAVLSTSVLRRRHYSQKGFDTAPIRMAFELTKEECDLTVQGAVVLGCGGGGPLSFARKITSQITKPAKVTPVEAIKLDDWLSMVVLIGQPSKVHDKPTEPLDEVDGPVERSEHLMRFIKMVRKVEDLNFFTHVGRRTLYDTPDSSPDVDTVDGTAPSVADTVASEPYVAAKNALRYLEKQCSLRSESPEDYPRFKTFKRLNHLLTGELGAVNVAVGLFLSSTMNLSVANCDGAGRSVPLIKQTTYADNFTVSPTIIVSPEGGDTLESMAAVTVDLPSGSESMVQQVAKALLSSDEGPFAHGYVGYGTYVVNGAEARGVPVENGFSIAFEIGKVIQQTTGRKRAEEICGVLRKYKRKCDVVFHGMVSDKSRQDHMAVHDIGFVTVRGKSSDFQLWYKNEIILAGLKGEPPKYMAPDSVCIVPADGEPFDISTITQRHRREREIYVIVVAADERLRTKKIVESFEKIYELFQDNGNDVYNGKYVSWTPTE